MADHGAALDEIERRLEAGQTDLRALGFWKRVGAIKRDPQRAAHADQVGRIDRRAFEARVSPRFPVWVGNLALVVATLAALGVVEVGLRLAGGRLGASVQPGWGGALIVAAAGGLSASVHTLAHWFAGRWVGIRFLWYFLDGPLRIQPGIKTDYASYLRVDASKRAAMHAAGALASKVAPFAVFGWVLTFHWQRGWDVVPPWSLWALAGLGMLQIVTDAVWSTKRSDWKKVRRELRVAREVGG